MTFIYSFRSNSSSLDKNLERLSSLFFLFVCAYCIGDLQKKKDENSRISNLANDISGIPVVKETGCFIM